MEHWEENRDRIYETSSSFGLPCVIYINKSSVARGNEKWEWAGTDSRILFIRILLGKALAWKHASDLYDTDTSFSWMGRLIFAYEIGSTPSVSELVLEVWIMDVATYSFYKKKLIRTGECYVAKCKPEQDEIETLTVTMNEIFIVIDA